MKKITKSQKGLTILELMIAVSAAVILILAAGIVIVIGQTSWNDTWGSVSLQRDASYGMLLMTRSIQAAQAAQKSSDGGTLYIPNQSDPNVIKFYYVADTNSLQLKVGGGSVQTVIAGGVNNLQFDVGTNTVTIDLSLKKDDAQAELKSTVMMRNYGG